MVWRGPSNSRKDSNFKDYTSTEVPLRLKKQYTQRQHLNGNVVALMVVEVNCRCWLRGRGRRERVTRQDSSKDSKFKKETLLSTGLSYQGISEGHTPVGIASYVQVVGGL